jgi:phosphoglycolate phosphatase-like HAD superfamily hydrolase
MKSANKIYEYDNYIFDCDGVILDSNFIKLELFIEIATPYCSRQELTLFKIFNENNPGLNREKKFNYLFESILQRDNYQADFEKVLTSFQATSLRRLESSSLIPGCADFLKKVNAARKYVVSAAQQDDLIRILKQKDIDKYFHRILGGPASKISLISELNITGSTLYFGDSNVDMESAQHFGYDFIVIYGATSWKNWKEVCNTQKVKSVKDFTVFTN